MLMLIRGDRLPLFHETATTFAAFAIGAAATPMPYYFRCCCHADAIFSMLFILIRLLAAAAITLLITLRC